MDGVTERLYHEIMCPTLVKTGPCNCQPVIVIDEAPKSARTVDAVDPSASNTGTLSPREKADNDRRGADQATQETT